jgi:hypothetical protein
MKIERSRVFHTSLAALFLTLAATPISAQAPPATAANVVLTTLTIKADADRAQVLKVMPDEVRATLKLYLDGKIQQWYARTDGRGVVFIMNCSTVAEAKASTDALPLSKAGLAVFEYTPLGPLSPLRMLLADPAPAPKGNPQP